MSSSFSDRYGITKPRSIQVASMDEALRVALWNWLCWAFERERRNEITPWTEEYWYTAAKRGMWDEVFHRHVDDIPTTGVRGWVKTWWHDAEWYQIYNLIEWLLPRIQIVRGAYRLRVEPGGPERLPRT